MARSKEFKKFTLQNIDEIIFHLEKLKRLDVPINKKYLKRIKEEMIQREQVETREAADHFRSEFECTRSLIENVASMRARLDGRGKKYTIVRMQQDLNDIERDLIDKTFSKKELLEIARENQTQFVTLENKRKQVDGYLTKSEIIEAMSQARYKPLE